CFSLVDLDQEFSPLAVLLFHGTGQHDRAVLELDGFRCNFSFQRFAKLLQGRNMNLGLSILVKTALAHVSTGTYTGDPSRLPGRIAAGGTGNTRHDGRGSAYEAASRRSFQLIELHGRLIALLTPGIIRDPHLPGIGGVIVLDSINKQVVP